jgi:Tfp pilus assembly protein PilW
MQKGLNMKTHRRIRSGLTLVELMTTMLISTIVVAGIGVAMVDTQRGFHQMYDRVQGDVTTDAYLARAVFDRICRKASIQRCLPAIGELGSYAEVYYYNDANSPSPDRYAQFRVANGTLLVDYGTYVASTKNKTLVTTETLATNIRTWQFAVQGSSVIMTLSFQKGNQSLTMTCSSVRHNE